jgi:hypothetical protein
MIKIPGDTQGIEKEMKQLILILSQLCNCANLDLYLTSQSLLLMRNSPSLPVFLGS